ncbi:MAG: sigma-70 family RNA polymerase sigma factor [Bryobacteraceae bacterium]
MKPIRNACSVRGERFVADTPEYLPDPLQKLAIQYSRKAVYDWRLPYDDREDLQQDLHLALWQKQSRFDASRGEADAFLRRVARNECIKLLKKRTAGRRDYRLDVALDDRKGQTLIGTCHNPLGAEKRLIRGIDVRRAIASLSPKLRRIANALRESTPTDLVPRLGASRATLYRMIASIRDYFRLRGLADVSI